MATLLLHNRKSPEILRQELQNEQFARTVISFYRYFEVVDPVVLRDELYRAWFPWRILGRVYVAHEGINAQLSIPDPSWENFRQSLGAWPELKSVFLNRATHHLGAGEAFIKLKIKVRKKIVADGIQGNILDQAPQGQTLAPLEFHQALFNPSSLVVDVRNHYECEIGHFRNAIIPQADNFAELLPELRERLQGSEEKPLYLYCTGGIRCEKASAYLLQAGFKQVYQLQGGIIHYLNSVAEHGLSSHYQGSLFVFDGRMAEKNSGEKLGCCYQCNAPHDTHSDCALESCHRLIIQCNSCRDQFDGCCSTECFDQRRLAGKSSAPLGMTLP